MSILIKGWKIPSCCNDCPFNNFGLDCYITKSDIDRDFECRERLGDCPLAEIPPHGDLIELNSVMETVTEWCPDDDGSVGKIGDLREVLNEIESLPIIIEAEGGKKMSVLIKGMEMPKKESCWIAIHPDGTVEYNKNDGYGWQMSKAIHVPPHGRLIDADALIVDVKERSESYFADDFAHEWVDVAPTVIPAEEDKE